MLLNVQSLNPSARSSSRWKLPYIRNKVLQKTKHIPVPFIALTETWLKPYIHDAQLDLENYNISRCDRSTRVGGGVLLYSHDSIPITNLQTFDDQTCQVLLCTCESSKVIVCVLYRPPDASLSSFKTCLSFISDYIADNDSYEMCLLGDYNLPLIDWNTNSVSAGHSLHAQQSASQLLEFMASHLLSQYVMEPTRLSNCLDLCLSNSPNMVTHVSVSDTPLSDHRLLEIFLPYNICSPPTSAPPDFSSDSFRSLDFHRADYDKMESLLSSVDWQELWNLSDPSEFPELLNLVLLQICDLSCPKKQLTTRKSHCNLHALSRKKRKLQSRLRVAEENPSSTTAHLTSLKNKISAVFADIRDAINNDLNYREEQAVNKVHCNPKYFYSYAKKFSKQKRSIPMLFDDKGNITANPTDIANTLQKQFSGVFSDPAATDISAASFQPPPLKKEFTDDLLSFTISDIIEAIDEIKPSAAAGPDDLPVLLLKKCKHTIAEPIQMIWHHSISTGTVPEFYKMSHIAPLHKKGSRAIAANYRPVSLTSHIVKIYERVLRKQMVAHLEENNLLCNKQHGFRSGKSCLTQLLHHFDDIVESLSNGSDVDAIYLDYAKAFDKVDHKLLIKKLHLYGFNPKLINWIESFLTGRTQKVVIDGHFSLLALIISGVPQGTVLGPILFLIFINDIEQCVVHSTIRCFADDTRICRSISDSSNVTELQADLDQVSQWSSRNNMALHEDKFEFICHRANKRNTLDELPFTADQYQYTTSLGTILRPVDQLSDLGITVSSDLSWSPHIRTMSNKARQVAAWVFSVFHSRRPDIMITLYKSLVRSHLEYCSPLWNPGKVSDIQEIESVQRTFTAKVHGFQHLHYWDRLKALSLMSLQRRRERYIVLNMWKILNGLTSNDLQVHFTENSRLGIQAKVPSIKKISSAAHQTLFESSFSVMGPRLWNCIPAKLRKISTLDSFKHHLTDFLLSVPDKPPIRGFTSPNSNSILDWRNDRDASALWGGQLI